MLAVCDAADTFEISDERLSEYEQSMLDAYEDLRVQFNSDDINDIYTLFSTSEDQIREDARNLLKERMAVGMVIDDNGLYPDDDAMQAAMEALAEADGTDLDSYLEEYGESYAQYAVLYDIASSYVTEHATVTENTVPSDWLPSASDDDGAEDDTGTEVTETTEATEG
jgi:FKBP-type peptidyl-prolyl cis-trans isomerase (trigger factor)